MESFFFFSIHSSEAPSCLEPQKFYLCTRASLLRSLTLHSLSRSDAHTDPQPGTTFETIEKALAAVNRRRGKKTRPRIPRRSRRRSSRPAAAEPGRRRPKPAPHLPTQHSASRALHIPFESLGPRNPPPASDVDRSDQLGRSIEPRALDACARNGAPRGLDQWGVDEGRYDWLAVSGDYKL